MCVMKQHRTLGEDRARSWEEESGSDASPRVLIESPDGAEAHAAWRLLQRHGYRTMWCPGPGPGGRGQPARECPLSGAGRCTLVDQADAVVSALDLHDEACGRVVRDLDAMAGDKRVVVVAPVDQLADLTRELASVRVVPGPLRAQVVLGVLDWGRASPS